jgi:hypothetical protein
MLRADLAGNTLLTARDVGSAVLSVPQAFEDSTNSNDLTDLYRLSLSSSSQLLVQLSQLTGDADLEVLDQTGHRIHGSFTANKGNDSLNLDLAAGTYYINVAHFDGNADYHLLIANANTPPPIVVPDPIVIPEPIVVSDPIVPIAPPPPNAPVIAPQLSTKDRSGDVAIDALVNPDGLYWDTSGSQGVITYSFYNAQSGAYSGTEKVSEVNDNIKASIREILKNLESYIDQRFVEVADTATSEGVIRYMFSDGGSYPDFYAYSYFPWMDAIGGDVHLNPIWDARSSGSFSKGAGTHGYTTLIHETLHALGLKHPGDYDAISTNHLDGPFLDPSQDNKSYTVMSYNHVGTPSITPLTYDIRALQYLYGTKPNATTNSQYQFTTPTLYRQDNQSFGNSNQPVNQLIADMGGIDTIDLSSSNAYNYHVDLRDGGLITTQSAMLSGSYIDRTTGQGFNAPQYGTWLSFGTVIENVVSSGGNDRIIANSAKNIFSGYSNRFGDDVLEQTTALDILDLSGNQRSQLRLTSNAGNLIIDWGTGDSVQVKDYFTSSAMLILIEGAYYTATATGTWQISASPAANDQAPSSAIAPIAPTNLTAPRPLASPTGNPQPLGQTPLLEPVAPSDLTPISRSQIQLTTRPEPCHCIVCEPPLDRGTSSPPAFNFVGQSDLTKLVTMI